MSEATINIPAEHVENVRRHLSISIGGAGESLDGFKDSPEAVRGAVDKVRALAAVMDQIGWEGDGERTLTANRELLAEPLGDALEYATDDIGGDWTDRSKLPELTERIKWLSDTLDLLEPEAVGGAA